MDEESLVDFLPSLVDFLPRFVAIMLNGCICIIILFNIWYFGIFLGILFLCYNSIIFA